MPIAAKSCWSSNVASACGLTPQYVGLEKLYEEKLGEGLVVAGFPANEFGAQEPGSNPTLTAPADMTRKTHDKTAR